MGNIYIMEVPTFHVAILQHQPLCQKKKRRNVMMENTKNVVSFIN
jgi:hypothetical protein